MVNLTTAVATIGVTAVAPPGLFPTELSTLLNLDPTVLEAYADGLDQATTAVRSLFRLAMVGIGSSIFFLSFIFFFVILPIAFFFEVVLKGERQFGEVADQVFVRRLVDALPRNVASLVPAGKDVLPQTDCEMSECEVASECELAPKFKGI